MTAIDPGIAVIACGQDAGWNAPLLDRDADILRSLSIHTLIGHPVPAETPAETVFRWIMAFPVWDEAYLADLGRRMGERVTPPRLAITELHVMPSEPSRPPDDRRGALPGRGPQRVDPAGRPGGADHPHRAREPWRRLEEGARVRLAEPGPSRPPALQDGAGARAGAAARDRPGLLRPTAPRPARRGERAVPGRGRPSGRRRR